MPVPIAQRSSAGMRKIHRELDRRRKLAVAAKGGVAKKSSAPPPPRRSEPATKKSSAPLRSASSSISRSPRRALLKAVPLPASLPSSAASLSVKRGMTVRVRTTVGTMRTGQRLVLWLSAVFVSAAEDGYLEVIYNGDFPRDDPFRTVRVATDQVKSMPPTFGAPRARSYRRCAASEEREDGTAADHRREVAAAAEKFEEDDAEQLRRDLERLVVRRAAGTQNTVTSCLFMCLFLVTG